MRIAELSPQPNWVLSIVAGDELSVFSAWMPCSDAAVSLRGFFIEGEQSISVIGVAHAKRSPCIWQNRVEH
jgi:hypothetical protein